MGRHRKDHLGSLVLALVKGRRRYLVRGGSHVGFEDYDAPGNRFLLENIHEFPHSFYSDRGFLGVEDKDCILLGLISGRFKIE